MPGGQGRGQGGGQGRGQGGGQGMGMGKNRLGTGPGGNCVCPACGAQLPHERGTPCTSLNCPDCGQKMTRG